MMPFLSLFQTVLGLWIQRLRDLTRYQGLAAASGIWKPPEVHTTESYINLYNYKCRYSIATKLCTLTQHNVSFLLVRSLPMVCYYKQQHTLKRARKHITYNGLSIYAAANIARGDLCKHPHTRGTKSFALVWPYLTCYDWQRVCIAHARRCSTPIITQVYYTSLQVSL